MFIQKSSMHALRASKSTTLLLATATYIYSHNHACIHPTPPTSRIPHPSLSPPPSTLLTPPLPPPNSSFIISSYPPTALLTPRCHDTPTHTRVSLSPHPPPLRSADSMVAGLRAAPLHPHCALTVHSLCTHCALTVHSLYTHCTLTVHSLYTHCTLTVHSLYTHCTLTRQYYSRPPHHHTITPSHHHTITPSHHRTITPSHHQTVN